MTKSKVNLGKVEQLYSGNLEKFGIDSRSVGWNSPEGQNLRFDKLLAVIENPSAPFTINELGCGYGELCKYLQKNKFNFSKFTGFDISKKMIEKAENYVQEKNCAFILKDKITIHADYSVTSGIFNVIFDEKKENWEEYILETLRNMNEFSQRGFSFNMLTKYSDYEAKDLYYSDPGFYFDFCKKEFSKQVALYHDYPLYEWTILVRKNL